MHIILVVVCLGAVAALIIGSKADEFSPFDPLKLELASDVGAPVAISTILPSNAAFVCLLGPYQDPNFLSDDIGLEFLEQLEQSSVTEGVVRLSTFDRTSKMLGEQNVPMWEGEVRIPTTVLSETICRTVKTVMVEVVEHGTYKSIQILE